MRAALLLSLMLVLAPMSGCHQVRKVPDEFLRPCSIPEPKNSSITAAVQVANARKEALQRCNAQLKRISESQR